MHSSKTMYMLAQRDNVDEKRVFKHEGTRRDEKSISGEMTLH